MALCRRSRSRRCRRRRRRSYKNEPRAKNRNEMLTSAVTAMMVPTRLVTLSLLHRRGPVALCARFVRGFLVGVFFYYYCCCSRDRNRRYRIARTHVVAVNRSRPEVIKSASYLPDPTAVLYRDRHFSSSPRVRLTFRFRKTYAACPKSCRTKCPDMNIAEASCSAKSNGHAHTVLARSVTRNRSSFIVFRYVRRRVRCLKRLL